MPKKGGENGGRLGGGGEGDGGGLLAAARATALPGPRQGLVLLWTVSICLDEFYKWARLPSTFEVLGLGLGLALALTS